MVGLPKEIQSDRGSNFTCELMQQIIFELEAKQILASAYHPESQGALEISLHFEIYDQSFLF